MIITLDTDKQIATVERKESDVLRIGYITGMIKNLMSDDWMDWTLTFKQPEYEHNNINTTSRQ